MTRTVRLIRRPVPKTSHSPLISRLTPSIPILPVARPPDVDDPTDFSVPQATRPTAMGEWPIGPASMTDDIRAQALAVLDKLQFQSVDWKSQLRVFALSFAAFVLVGWLLTLALRGFTVITLVSLIVVLVIHETGHYLAMRAFGYRNLKMFFIPLFGAAVSGYGHVPVVEESMVYLLGPLPGILIGYGCGLIFLLTRLEIWRDLAVLFVAINALNLLPVFPLDGGRFVFGLLSRRTYRYQWVLQVVIAVGLFGLTFVGRFSQLSTVAGIALGGTWQLARSNKIAERIRTSPIGQVAPAGEPLPERVKADLIDLVRTESASEKPKDIAELAWHAWTQATAQRPTTLETLGLAAIYILTFLSVIIAQAIYAEVF